MVDRVEKLPPDLPRITLADMQELVKHVKHLIYLKAFARQYDMSINMITGPEAAGTDARVANYAKRCVVQS